MKTWFVFFSVFILGVSGCGYPKKRDQRKEMERVVSQLTVEDYRHIFLKVTKDIADLSRKPDLEEDFVILGEKNLFNSKYILIGEFHYDYSNAIKNVALINKYFEDPRESLTETADVLLLEGSPNYFLHIDFAEKLLERLVISYIFSSYHWAYNIEDSLFFQDLLDPIESAFFYPRRGNLRKDSAFKQAEQSGYKLLSFYGSGWDLLDKRKKKYSPKERNFSIVESLKKYETKDKSNKVYFGRKTPRDAEGYDVAHVFLIAGAGHIPFYEFYKNSKFIPNNEDFDGRDDLDTIEIFNFLKDKMHSEIIDKAILH